MHKSYRTPTFFSFPLSILFLPTNCYGQAHHTFSKERPSWISLSLNS